MKEVSARANGRSPSMHFYHAEEVVAAFISVHRGEKNLIYDEGTLYSPDREDWVLPDFWTLIKLLEKMNVRVDHVVHGQRENNASCLGAGYYIRVDCSMCKNTGFVPLRKCCNRRYPGAFLKVDECECGEDRVEPDIVPCRECQRGQ